MTKGPTTILRRWASAALGACLLSAACGGVGYAQSAEGGPPLSVGDVLGADQIPRFLRPNEVEEFGFDPITVVGDHESVTFERFDLTQDAGVTRETWQRLGTDAVSGQLVSVFRPSWSPAMLQGRLRSVRWGVDRPFVSWGELVVSDGEGERRHEIRLRMAPTQVPAADIVVVDDAVQYTSHVVNLRIVDFGNDRLENGTDEWDLSAVTGRFYQHFADSYETIAIVTQSMQPTEPFHRNVRNAVAGIGLPIFDDTAQYGSSGVLQGVEVYSGARWADMPTVLHQQAHQWSDYSQAWAAAGLDRQGHLPEIHTPLLFPGAVMAGAVLEPTRRVGSPDEAEASLIERTFPIVEYNPLTLYRMGLVAPSDLPVYRVFEDQGQFDPETRVAPSVGTEVEGVQLTVTAEDLVAADGIRNGPVTTQVRRALVYVTRTGLASQDEMDVLTYFAARAGAAEGVTTWDGFPSFSLATGGGATMATDITPAAGSELAKLFSGIGVAYPAVPNDVLVGVELADEVPGRIAPGETVILDGTLTLTERTDYNIVCFRFIRYGASDVNEVFVCGTLDGINFSVPVTFAESQRGTYTMESFVFWTDSGPQAALSRYGVIVVD